MSLCDMEGGSGVLYIQKDSEWGVCTVWLWEHAAQNHGPFPEAAVSVPPVVNESPTTNTTHANTNTHIANFLSPIVSLSLLTWGEQTATAAAYNFALAAHVGKFGGL